jgi:hypothetical protein
VEPSLEVGRRRSVSEGSPEGLLYVALGENGIYISKGRAGFVGVGVSIARRQHCDGPWDIAASDSRVREIAEERKKFIASNLSLSLVM